MDFSHWVHEATVFAEAMHAIDGISRFELEIKPQLPLEHLGSLEDRWPTGIPKPLKDFWTTGSRHFHFLYVFNPPQTQSPQLEKIFPKDNYISGGPCFEPAQEIYPGNSGWTHSDEDIGEGMRGEIGEDAYRLWCEAAVILHVGNGDLIALDQTDDPVDPPVVYLSHDDSCSGRIASSFANFLQSWAALSFIGPAIWLLSYWLDESTGFIDPNKHMADELRSLLQPRNA